MSNLQSKKDDSHKNNSFEREWTDWLEDVLPRHIDEDVQAVNHYMRSRFDKE